MARTAAVARDEVVRRARDLFWRVGFDGASIADVEAATGQNRSSIYAAFGSKRGLFDAAVDDYRRAVLAPLLETLRADPAAPAALPSYFAALASAIERAAATGGSGGCLLLDSVPGLAATDDEHRAVVAGYRSELVEAIDAALAAADPAAAPADVARRASILAGAVVAAILRSRIDAAGAVADLALAAAQAAEWSRA